MFSRSAPDSLSLPIAASTPADTRIYAVGDVHGRADLLAETIERIDEDLERRPVAHAVEIYLGDYIDRGADSKGVIDLLAARVVQGNTVCLRGNHEELLERFLTDAGVLQGWIKLGGLQTLASYDIRPYANRAESPEALQARFREAFPPAHALFLKCLKPWVCCGDYLFVHAGIRPQVPLDQQSMHDLLWIRDEFLNSTHHHGKCIVHGHTPVRHPDLRHNRINIDTGAWQSGTLTCAVLEGASIQFL
jgi:serine/threonine protein phosphatase 1